MILSRIILPHVILPHLILPHVRLSMPQCKIVRVVLLMLLILSQVLVFSPLLYAHGIRYSLDSGGVGVQAFFDDDQPAKGLSVSIFAPGSSEKFQTGKTDLHGRFVFFPDRQGNWDVLIFDQMGHRLEITVPVNEAMKGEKRTDENSFPLYPRAIAGITVIFGIFGLMVRLMQKRR